MRFRQVFIAAMLAAISCCFVLAATAPLAYAQGSKPNFVVIMTDDFGWGDMGAYGGGVMRGAPTPNLDRLAAEGMRFVNYYGQASCTAGRASFITGRIPIRTALSTVLVPGIRTTSRRRPRRSPSSSRKGRATRTVQLGKWHLGDVEEAYPTSVGFDEMYHMLPYYAGVYAYDDLSLNPAWPQNDKEFMAMWNTFNLNQWEGKAGQPAKNLGKFTYQDLSISDTQIRETAIKWIQAHAKDQKPFFMYLNFMKVHQPNFPSPEWKGKSPAGMPYQDSVMELDDNSGKVVQAIRDLGIAENTLVVWTTDNGAWLDAWPDAGYTPFRGMKGSAYEGGFRVPAIAWWPGKIKAGEVATEMMSHMDWWPTFARLAGVEPPPRIWKDNKGKPIVFDGLDNSDYLLGKGPSKRDDMFYFYDQSFGAIRVKNYKFVFTAKDTWLGPSQPLTSAPAVYNLLWDPAEQYDILFNGAAPTRSPTNSPGKFAGPDHGWTVGGYLTPRMYPFFEEMAKYPNLPSKVKGGLYFVIPPDNRP